MNYAKIYNKIIDYRKQHRPEGYVEVHHILPRSLGGDDQSNNLVALTAREHFLCHLLLTKIHTQPGRQAKMLRAFMAMLMESTNQQRHFSSRRYEQLRTKFALLQSQSQSGAGNSQHATMWINSIELRQSKKIGKNEAIPQGWKRGRVVDWDKREKKTKRKEDAISKKKEYVKERTELYEGYYKIYNEVGFDEFVKITGYEFSHPNLVRAFAKYLRNFKPQSRIRRGK